jgi:hypothetical protein
MALNPANPAGPPADERDPGLDRLYSAAGRDEPPASLDMAILAAARREVGAGPRRVGAALRAWRMPIALAAVLVLSVSVVLLMKAEGPDGLETPIPAPPAAAPQSEDRREGTAVEPLHASPKGAPAPSHDPPHRRRERPAQTQTGDGGAQDLEASRSPPRIPAPRAAEQNAGKAMRPESAVEEGRGQGAARDAATTGVPAQPAAPQRSIAGNLSLGRAAVWSDYELQPPPKWLERIEELRRAGRDEDADAMLKEFRRRFPDHPAPSEVR